LIKTDNLTSEEKLAIVDNTLCNLTTWLDGASLAQTLFTNLYFHDPNVLTDAYTKYFSIAMLKIVDSMRNKILTAAVFEEVKYLGIYVAQFYLVIVDVSDERRTSSR
jgi:hypothetical protein